MILGVHDTSLAAFGIVFFGVAFLLKRQGVSNTGTFLISLCSMLSMIWSFEFFWYVGLGTQGLEVLQLRFLVFDPIEAGVGLVGYQYANPKNRLFLIALVANAIMVILWVGAGIPFPTKIPFAIMYVLLYLPKKN